jgi:transposase
MFALTVLSTRSLASSDERLPVLISYQGKNIIQYKRTMKRAEERKFRETPPTINRDCNQRRDNKWRVRFIQLCDIDLLESWRKSKDKNLWERAVTILENRNLSLAEISSKIERPISVLQGWITAFHSRGVTGLTPSKRRRSPDKRTRASEEKQKRLLEILHDRPASFAINRSNWNLSSLAMAYKETHGEEIGRTTVSRLLKKTGYRLKKAKRVLTSPDPNYRDKVELVLQTLQSLQPSEQFFFIDELGPLRVQKYGGRIYTKKNDSPSFPQLQRHKGSITLSGALSATTNQMTWFYGKSKDTSAMIELIEILFNEYHDKSRLYITWDAASWHDSNRLVAWLDEFNQQTVEVNLGPVIDLVPLPSCSQFLNVIESIFSGMKRAVVHNSDYQSERDMKIAISLHFSERNEYFKDNPKRVGKKIWEVDFFRDIGDLKAGDYRDW